MGHAAFQPSRLNVLNAEPIGYSPLTICSPNTSVPHSTRTMNYTEYSDVFNQCHRGKRHPADAVRRMQVHPPPGMMKNSEPFCTSGYWRSLVMLEAVNRIILLQAVDNNIICIIVILTIVCFIGTHVNVVSID